MTGAQPLGPLRSALDPPLLTLTSVLDRTCNSSLEPTENCLDPPKIALRSPLVRSPHTPRRDLGPPGGPYPPKRVAPTRAQQPLGEAPPGEPPRHTYHTMRRGLP
jgi:hypothetical protein